MEDLALLPVDLQRRVRDYVALYRVVTPTRSVRAIHSARWRDLWVVPDAEEWLEDSDGEEVYEFRFNTQRKSAMWWLTHPDLGMVCYRRPRACWP